jgi:hypothetical protein
MDTEQISLKKPRGWLTKEERRIAAANSPYRSKRLRVDDLDKEQFRFNYAKARDLGLKYFFTGEPCPAGHIDLRFVSSRGCRICARYRTRYKYKKEGSVYLNRRKAARDSGLISPNDPLFKRMWIGNAYRRIRGRCEQFDMPFDLDIPFMMTLLVADCPVLGIPLVYSGLKKKSPMGPSFDRIDPNKGYTKDNVWIISERANLKRFAIYIMPCRRR